MILSKSTVPSGLCMDYVLFLVGKNIGFVKSLKNMHGYFHWFISNRAKDIKY